jgi:hypothetical protein
MEGSGCFSIIVFWFYLAGSGRQGSGARFYLLGLGLSTFDWFTEHLPSEEEEEDEGEADVPHTDAVGGPV